MGRTNPYAKNVSMGYSGGFEVNELLNKRVPRCTLFQPTGRIKCYKLIFPTLMWYASLIE